MLGGERTASRRAAVSRMVSIIWACCSFSASSSRCFARVIRPFGAAAATTSSAGTSSANLAER